MVKCPFSPNLDCVTVNCRAWRIAKDTGTETIIAGCIFCPQETPWVKK